MEIKSFFKKYNAKYIMKLYHRFFIVLKIIIVMLIVLNKVYETKL